MTTYQIFGSASSLDTDICFFVDYIGSISENNKVLNTIIKETKLPVAKKINGNLGVISDGVLTHCFKGTPDELNNALFFTYGFHEQHYTNQVSKLVKRDLDLKMVRCARTIVSYFTRTELRTEAKNALKDDFKAKINFLESLKLTKYVDFGKNGSQIEVYKTIAFQLGQTLALMNGIEVYTKEAIAEVTPVLNSYLFRESISCYLLQNVLEKFVIKSKIYLPEMKKLAE